MNSVYQGIALFLFLSQLVLAGPAINQRMIHIPMKTEHGIINLETLLVVPNDNQSHPVALISHGTPREKKIQKEMTPLYFLPHAYEFARRGYAVAVVMRRSYGDSGGEIADRLTSCANPDYQHATGEAIDDLEAAIQYLSTLKQFDTNNLIAIGVSAGGLASIGLSAINPPSGLRAVINFAGGQGSYASDKICHPELLARLFAAYGETSRVPTLWVYAENDQFFKPSLAKQWALEFEDNGGEATFVTAPPFSEDGHSLFSGSGISIWSPIVDKFLRDNKLPLAAHLLPIPEKTMNIPENLPSNALNAFKAYLLEGSHKAFAISPKGAYGWQVGRRTVDQAKRDALGYCNKYDSGCMIIAVDDQIVSEQFTTSETPDSICYAH